MRSRFAPRRSACGAEAARLRVASRFAFVIRFRRAFFLVFPGGVSNIFVAIGNAAVPIGDAYVAFRGTFVPIGRGFVPLGRNFIVLDRTVVVVGRDFVAVGLRENAARSGFEAANAGFAFITAPEGSRASRKNMARHADGLRAFAALICGRERMRQEAARFRVGATFNGFIHQIERERGANSQVREGRLCRPSCAAKPRNCAAPALAPVFLP